MAGAIGPSRTWYPLGPLLAVLNRYLGLISERPTPSPAAARWPHIYVHVPFCGRRCSYCDFAIAVRKDVPVSEFNDAIMAEMVTRQIRGSDAAVRSIYLGGGTPSKLGGAGIAALLRSVAQQLGVEKLSTLVDELEVTIEVNPEDISAEAAAAWVAAGVNRASIGVQSFDPDVLRWMHREHTVEQVGAGVRILRAAGIQELSLDLIFAVPESLGRSWTRDLEEVLKLDAEHLSLYGLTVEPQTPLGRWTARGEVAEAPEERYAEEFLEAHERLSEAGFDHYEVSNYGRPGHRARHNSAYWSGAPYLGLGPSAHGFDGGERRWNRSAYADWLRAVQEGTDPVEGSEVLSEAERVSEQVYLGLRTSGGLSIRQSELKTVTPWLEAGWARLRASEEGAGREEHEGGTLPRARSESRPGAPGATEPSQDAGSLTLTPKGWLRLDALAVALTSLRSPS